MLGASYTRWNPSLRGTGLLIPISLGHSASGAGPGMPPPNARVDASTGWVQSIRGAEPRPLTYACGPLAGPAGQASTAWAASTQLADVWRPPGLITLSALFPPRRYVRPFTLERSELLLSRLRTSVPVFSQIGDRCKGLSAVRLSHRQPDQGRNLSKNLAPLLAARYSGLNQCKDFLVEKVY